MEFKDLLIVVDAQNDFLLPTGKLFIGHDTTEYRKRLGEFVSKFPGYKIVTVDNHNKKAVEFELFPEHCLKDSEGCKIISEINQEIIDDFFSKNAYNSHNISSAVARSLYGKIRTVGQVKLDSNADIYVVGVCTSICVHDIIIGIINETKNTYNQIPKIKIIRNLVDDFDPEMAEFSLKRLQKFYGVEIFI